MVGVRGVRIGWVVGIVAGVVAVAAVLAFPASSTKPDSDPALITREVLARASQEQRDRVGDAQVVSRRHYEEATAAALECMRSAGLTVSDVRQADDATGMVTYQVSVPLTLRDGNRLMDECDMTHARDIRTAWAMINAQESEAGR